MCMSQEAPSVPGSEVCHLILISQQGLVYGMDSLPFSSLIY